MKASYVNAGSIGEVNNAADVVSYWANTMFSAAMSDDNRTMDNEEYRCMTEVKRLVKELQITAEDLRAAEKLYVSRHTDGGYCKMSDHDIDEICKQ